jgi:simple sugar transport system substrate-binding protein
MKHVINAAFITVLAAVFAVLPGCTAKEKQESGLSILVYITGVTAGSPTYAMLAEGALEFAAENPGVNVRVYEAGFNQAEWEEQLSSLVADGSYDIVLGSNPSLPEICMNVSARFPEQKFLITDAFYEGHPAMSTWLFNQYEQSLFLGYLAGLITTSNMPLANSAKRIGFIAAQEFPLLTRHKIPGFIDGARRVDPEISLDFRVIGNWFDANKAADLASSMIDSGVDVFSSNAGGAAQGLIRTIREKGAYAVFYNNSEYHQAPGHIIGCGIMEQKKLVKEILNNAIAGKIQYGTARLVGVQDGYLGFIDDAGYRNYVPENIQERFDAFMEELRSGRLEYTLPQL